MTLDERISSLSALGDLLRSFTGQPDNPHADIRIRNAITQAEQENPWFTHANCLIALRYWGSVLRQDLLYEWTARYQPAIGEERLARRIGIVMAGNIPMVGFHDLLCVLLTGNHACARLSSQDTRLIPTLTGILTEQNPAWQDHIEMKTSEIENPDAIIATGSNNTFRYFHYYFGKYPHIIRKNRTGVAVLDGNESDDELKGVASDIFTYFGLGCRNVSKLHLPERYDFRPLHNALSAFGSYLHHTQYRNNLDYYKSIFLVNRTHFIDGGFYLLAENTQPATPVSLIHYTYYNDIAGLRMSLDAQVDQIQCVIARGDAFPGAVLPGRSQHPDLSDYADGIDTLSFLLEKI